MATTDASHTPAAAPPVQDASHDSAAPALPIATTAGRPIRPSSRQWVWWTVGVIAAVVVLAAGVPWVVSQINTVSTDDAYVNGHVTFVAPRVAGQVVAVYVDDNNRVHKGQILVQLDKTPFVVQVHIATAAVEAAKATLAEATAQTRSTEAQARSLRYALEHAVEDVDNQIALLNSKVAALASAQASYEKAKADYNRAEPLVSSGAVTKEDLDRRKEAMLVAQADVEQARQAVYQVRVGLGLPPAPPDGGPLTEVPADLDQTFSTVREAQLQLAQAAAELGVYQPLTLTPKQMIANFYSLDPKGNIDAIYDKLLKTAPAVKVAQTKFDQAQADLDQAKLNLLYTDIVAEIDGVVTRRDVNVGNNVVVGQSLMAIRSLTDIWIDANFKETQLGKLAIGQKVTLDVDMYGSRHEFQGLISGFTMGTGSTLALIPAENATGNFVKVVQRLPVRIDLVDYKPDNDPLFIGLSVTPHVHLDQGPAEVPDAGKKLQRFAPTAGMDSAAYVPPPSPAATTGNPAEPATSPAAPETRP